MLEVYVVRAVYDYEGEAALKAFETEADAETFVQACEAHSAKQPEMTDEAFDSGAYQRRYARWRKKHPAGKEDAHADSFCICKIPFVAASAAEGNSHE